MVEKETRNIKKMNHDDDEEIKESKRLAKEYQSILPYDNDTTNVDNGSTDLSSTAAGTTTTTTAVAATTAKSYRGRKMTDDEDDAFKQAKYLAMEYQSNLAGEDDENVVERFDSSVVCRDDNMIASRNNTSQAQDSNNTNDDDNINRNNIPSYGDIPHNRDYSNRGNNKPKQPEEAIWYYKHYNEDNWCISCTCYDQ